MNRRYFISGLSFGTLFLGMVPWNKLLAFDSFFVSKKIQNIPFKRQIRHGLLNETNVLNHINSTWLHSFSLQSFMANGMHQENNDLTSLQFHAKEVPVHVSVIKTKGIINCALSETHFTLEDGIPAQFKLSNNIIFNILRFNQLNSITIDVSNKSKIICLTGQVEVDGQLLAQGQCLELTSSEQLQITGTKESHLCWLHTSGENNIS